MARSQLENCHCCKNVDICPYVWKIKSPCPYWK